MRRTYETLRPEGRDEWLRLRREGVGGSDVAAIMGISPWAGPYTVWAEKLGLAEPEDISGNPRVEWGTILEPTIVERVALAHPELEVRGNAGHMVMRSLARPWALATVDAMATDPETGERVVVEAKTAHYPSSKGWGDPADGADGVPAHYLCQVAHYLTVTGARRAIVAVLIDGYDLREYEVVPDEGDIEAVVGAVDGFWADHVLAEVPPEALASDVPALLEAHPGDGRSYREGTAEELGMVDAWRGLREAVADATEDARALQARIEAAIGDDQGLYFPEGRVRWSRTATRRLDTARLRRERPEVYEAYLVDGRSGRLTWRDA